MSNQIKEINVNSEEQQVELIVKKALEDPTKSHPIGLQQEIFSQSEGKLSHCLKKSTIQNTLANVRRELFIPPTEIKACKLIKTYSGENLCPQVKIIFYLFKFSKVIECPEYTMIFFSSRSQMVNWKIHEPIQIFVDGYHKVPKPFVQLVTILAMFPNLKKSLPIMSVLTTKKTKEAYRKLFSRADAIMREEFSQDIKLLDVKLITIDFELALIGAVDEYWPEAKKQGCFVHFLRAQVNNLKRFGFGGQENKKKNYQLITLMSSLAFIDESKIVKVFEAIKNLTCFADYNKYFDYFSDTWIDGNFSIELWNSFNKVTQQAEYCDKLKHSNNTIESFHSLLNYILKKSSRPTIGEFIQAMRDVEGITKTNLNVYENKFVISVTFTLF